MLLPAQCCAVRSHSKRAADAKSCLNGLVIPPEHFLRVSFGDESTDRLFSNRDEPIDVFYGRMENVLNDGE